MHVSAILDPVVEQFESSLDARLSAIDLPPDLAAAARYAVLGGGKRLRPALVLLSAMASGGTVDDALWPAGAIELVHSFSLVHDDLPAMDDDDLRRGQPTLHRHAGEAMAILTGDLLLNLAFDWIIRTPVEDAVRIALTRELADATTGMIVGQVYDTLGGLPELSDDRTRLELIHRNKTGALIRASVRLGAMSAGADAATLDALTAYGEAIGLMFQIVDDLLDVTQTSEHVGKATGKDEAAGKLTFPGVLGVERSRQEVDRLGGVAASAIGPLGDGSERLRLLAEALAVRTR